jgi:hypothetical protein
MTVYNHSNFLLTYYSSTLQIIKVVGVVIANLSPDYKFSLPK